MLLIKRVRCGRSAIEKAVDRQCPIDVSGRSRAKIAAAEAAEGEPEAAAPVHEEGDEPEIPVQQQATPSRKRKGSAESPGTASVSSTSAAVSSGGVGRRLGLARTTRRDTGSKDSLMSALGEQ